MSDTDVIHERAVSMSEAQRRIGTARPTMYNFIRSGELETFVVGRRRFTTDRAISNFIARRIEASRGLEWPDSNNARGRQTK